MGIFSAMNTAITGLSAQSTALEHISNNIANSQTVGYKRTETSFAELVQESNPHRQALGVVQARSRATNDIQGQTQSSSIKTHMAINDDGYFIVTDKQSTVDGKPVFNAEDLYTRRGDFELDADGYLVNSTGYYLKGLLIDPNTGNQDGSVPELIKVSEGFLPAKATSTIDYSLNLPSEPSISAAGGGNTLDPAGFNQDPTIAGTGIVIGDDAARFVSQSISGGSVTAYNATGTPVNMEIRWAKMDSVASGGDDKWEMFYQVDTNATGGATSWKNAAQEYKFGGNGKLDPDITSIPLAAVVIEGIELGDIKLDHSNGSVTQYANADGTARSKISQNGYASGEFTNLTLSDDGRILANYNNGSSQALAKLSLAQFASDGNLAKVDGGALRQTTASGSPVFTTTANIISEALESSNTDIADEFSKLIVTQQAYAANTRIVSTGDKMMQEVLNMVR